MNSDQAELLQKITSLLEKLEIPYMVTGAWSVIYYGRPRASHDIDFVVELNQKNAQKILIALESLTEEFIIQREAVEQALAYKSMFNVIHLPTMLKLDFWLLTEDSFDKSRFSRRKKVTALDHFMTLSSPEDTILQKLRWYKEAKIEKHLVDAAFVYQIQKDNLDFEYLTKWAKKLDVINSYKKLSKINLENYL